MTPLTIDPTTLKSLCKARKLGRPRLAREAGLTERQVARLEGGGPAQGSVTPEQVVKLSAMLQVSADVLVGAAPLHELDLAPRAKSPCSCCG